MRNVENKKLGFRAKTYGWGWYPCSWQGCIAVFIWGVLFVTAIIKMDHEWLKNLLFIFLFTAILIYLAYKKGEKPGWNWGKRK